MSDEIKKKSFPIRVLGRKLSFLAPAEIADVERLTEKGAVLAGYYQQYCFHDRGPELKQRVARKIEAFLNNEFTQGFVAETNDDGSPKLDSDGKPKIKYTESEKKFYDRVFATGKLSIADIDRLLEEANDEIGDWSPGTVSNRKPAKEFYDLADEIIKRTSDPAKGDVNKEKYIANVQKKLGDTFESLFGEFNRDNVARAVKAVDDKVREESRAKALAAFDDEDVSDETE